MISIQEVALYHQDIITLSRYPANAIEVLADEWACRVTDEHVAVQALRQGVAWANALDAEACRVYGANLEIGGQKDEREARRILHHAGRGALDLVGTEWARLTFSARNSRLSSRMM